MRFLPERSSRPFVLRLIPLACAIVLGGVLGVGFAAVIDMPRIDSLSDFTPSLITELRDREGEVFATFARERRFLLDEGQVPELLQQAILSGEDSNFFQHGGIDPLGVLRAILRNVQGGNRIGGSTLTMQLARRLYLTPEKTWRRKIEEAFLTVEIEKSFSKQQILTLYSNMMFLGHGNYGMEAAAQSYFGKTASELTAAEAATLVGILQRPGDYSPYRRPDLVEARRNYVLRRMNEEGYLDQEEYEAAAATHLEVRRPKREARLAPYFAEEVRKEVEETYGADAVFEKGLQIETSLDPAIQRAAERALRAGLLRLDHQRGFRGALDRVEIGEPDDVQLESWALLDAKPGAWAQGVVLSSDRRTAQIKIADRTYELNAEGMKWTRRSRPRDLLKAGDVAWFRIGDVEADSAGDAAAAGEAEEADEAPIPTTVSLEQEPLLEGALVVLESATGAVRGMVGGWDFDRSKFNRATQAKRQVGSAFKPFVWGAALESGYTLADTFFDAPTAFPGTPGKIDYSPRNYYREYHGIITLRRALEVSANVTAVKVLDLVGGERVVDFAHRSGIQSGLQPYPSLALGAADLSPLEVAGAYASIANQGLYVAPYMIESVRERDGRLLEEHRTQAAKAMEPVIAALLTHNLEGVVDRGTAKEATGLPLALAGKTGTTDDYSDAWFVGYTPRYTMLAWVGHDVKRPIGRNMSGAVAALPIWIDLVEAGLEEGWLQEGETFAPSAELALLPVEYTTGFLPAPGAERVVEEAFIKGTEPVLSWSEDWRRIMGLPWYQQRVHYVPKANERMPEDEIADWEGILTRWNEEEEEEEGAD